jgi:hypothetical protein
MSTRGVVVSALAVAAVVVAAVLVFRGGAGGKKESAPKQPKAAGTGETGGASDQVTTKTSTSGSSGTGPAARERPSLPVPAPMRHLRHADSIDARFDGEKRDPSWASSRESAIRDRLSSLGPKAVKVGEIECRRQYCRIPLSGTDQKAFLGFVERLQGPEGFYKRAKQFHLANFSKAEGSQPASVTVYLRYERDD